jgi:hypothetical protein
LSTIDKGASARSAIEAIKKNRKAPHRRVENAHHPTLAL